MKIAIFLNSINNSDKECVFIGLSDLLEFKLSDIKITCAKMLILRDPGEASLRGHKQKMAKKKQFNLENERTLDTG